MISFSDSIRLELGTYRSNPQINSAQRRLYTRIGTDQVVWCSQEIPPLPEAGRYLHHIDVDPSDVVAVVDALVWNHIIGPDPFYVLPEDHAELRRRASLTEDYDGTLKQFVSEYLDKYLPKDLWGSVLKPEIEKASDQVILGFPFCRSQFASVDPM